MSWRRHAIAAGAALAAFGIFTLISGAAGWPALIAMGVLALCLTIGYFHYRRRQARAEITPVTPARDDRVIPQTVKILVSARDKGECQIKGPPCTGAGEVFDHIFPWSKGGSSKDPDNIQLACAPCNAWKSDKVLV